MVFAPGTVATFTTVFRDGDGVITDAVDPRISISDLNMVEVVSNVVPIRISAGFYLYSYPLPTTAPVGIWSVAWSGTVAGVGQSNSTTFTVEAGLPGGPQPGVTLFAETAWLPRFAQERIGIIITRSGQALDPDAYLAAATVVRVTGGVVSSRSCVREAEGTYGFTLVTDETVNPGLYQVTWNYTLAGVAHAQTSTFEVGESSPDYLTLDYDMRSVVDQVWVLFADGFDSPYGGPNLQTYFQSRGFGRNRLAQLLHTAMGVLNTVSQPHMTYQVGGPKDFPVGQWGALLERALYIEALKHLMRGYVEQPLMEGVGTARADRRDYLQRWGDLLQIETPHFDSMLDTFKIANMGLGRPRALVSGGAYGNWGPTRLPMSAAARPRYWASIVH